MNSKFKITIPVSVRFSDTDALGHVNNARYLSFMEEGRVSYFKALFKDDDQGNAFALFPFILADVQCAFKSPVFFGETVTVALGVVETKNSSFVMEYELHSQKDSRLVATGRTVLVCYDYKTKMPVRISAEFRARVEKLEGR